MTLATDTVGTGPRLQLSQRDDKRIRQIEDDFERWTQAVNLPEKLRTMRMAKATDGEVFAILTSNQKLNHSVKLDITPIEAERIASPFSFDDTIVDGIEFDTFGNVTNYHLLQTHPGDLKSLRDKTVRVAAKDMIHWFRSDRPEQHRGVPELAPALPLFAQLRRYTLAATCSCIAVVLPHRVTPSLPLVACITKNDDTSADRRNAAGRRLRSSGTLAV